MVSPSMTEARPMIGDGSGGRAVNKKAPELIEQGKPEAAEPNDG